MGTTIQLTSEHEHDFWARVDRSEEGGCWLWTGTQNKDGYPTVTIDKDRVGAPRVAWVLHHRRPLPSYQQVRRRCKCTTCVRPTHMVRANTSYSKYAARGGKTSFTLLKPPVGGKTEAPKQETVAALSGSFKELQQLRVLLHALSGALPQTDKKQQKNHEKTQAYVAELTASVESLREEMLRWAARTEKRLTRIEEAMEGIQGVAEPEVPPPRVSDSSGHAASDKASDEPGEPVNGQEPKGMSLVLMDAFQAELGATNKPQQGDYESLDMVFDIALDEAKEPSAAVARFGSWLTAFRALTAKHPSLERTPQGFAREVAARRLEND